MATSANYVGTPKLGVAQVSTANTNLDGTGTLGTIFTAGSSGSRIDSIAIKATGTTTAGMVRLFIHDGTNARLLSEVPVLAITPSATLPAFEVLLTGDTYSQLFPIILPNTYSLRASTHAAETFNVIASGGDF